MMIWENSFRAAISPSTSGAARREPEEPVPRAIIDKRRALAQDRTEQEDSECLTPCRMSPLPHPIEPGSMSQRVEMYNKNALKIGLFGANCSSARTATLVPERWIATWPDCLKMARIADEAGIDFLLPIGRWKGYGGDSDFHGTTLETVTWACGLLARHATDHGVRHRARAAVPSADRRQGDGHRRPHR